MATTPIVHDLPATLIGWGSPPPIVVIVVMVM
jgi:hypothetical protein